MFRTKYTSWRQATTPYRRLGFVGDALSITVRRGGIRPASREHADQTSGTHYNTSLTLRETAQPNLTTPPFNPSFTHPSPALFYRLTILLPLRFTVTYRFTVTSNIYLIHDYMIPCNSVLGCFFPTTVDFTCCVRCTADYYSSSIV